MKKTLYFKLNPNAKYFWEKYTQITKEEAEKMEFVEDIDSVMFFNKIYKEKA